ncbi:MAG: GAF domain-containing protein [Gammaproteobacteria bacterium]
MTRRLLIAMPLTIIAVAAFIQMTLFYKNSGLPFNVVTRGSSRYIAQLPGIPLPTGLKVGDELDLQQSTPVVRAALLPNMNLGPGLRYTFMVRRGAQILNVPVTTRELPISGNLHLNIALNDALFFALLILGLLAIWRARNLAAWGLGIFAVVIIVQVGLRNLPLPATWIMGSAILAYGIVFPFLFVGLFLMAYALSAGGLHRRIKWIFTGVFALFYLLFVAINFISILSFVLFNLALIPSGLAFAISIVSLVGLGAISFVLLVLGYARAGAEQRLRIRWILYSTGLMLLVIVITLTAVLSDNPAYQLVTENIGNFLFLLAVIGYTYAVLSQRLVNVRIVLNRTLVYGVITAIVVGVFAAINSVVEHATLGRGASLLLELIVPLALGIVLGSLRKYVDTYINRWLFRRQYRAEKALNDFARTCGFIEQPERLLDLTAQLVFEHSHAQSVALYERESEGYRRVRQLGAAAFPERVEADDLVFVRLRAGDQETDLHEVASVLGRDGYVFPMAVRGRLIGALACGPRPAEQYTVDERQLLLHVSQQAGAALHALRSREHELFVNSVASGDLDGARARERARQLAAVWQTA